jgi:hypothetical protein
MLHAPFKTHVSKVLTTKYARIISNYTFGGPIGREKSPFQTFEHDAGSYISHWVEDSELGKGVHNNKDSDIPAFRSHQRTDKINE